MTRLRRIAQRLTRDERRVRLSICYGDFRRCPNTGHVIGVLPGDDKVLCSCGQPNPAVPTEYPGVHVARLLTPATVDDYLDQEERDEETAP